MACAIIYVDEGIDNGDIIAQKFYGIGQDEAAREVMEKTLEIFPRLLVDVVKRIENNSVKAVKQDVSVGAYYCKPYSQDGQIFWDMLTQVQVHNLV